MDTWYATKGMMLQIEKFKKIYYYPLQSNRSVDNSGGSQPYQRVESLAGIEDCAQQACIANISV